MFFDPMGTPLKSGKGTLWYLKSQTVQKKQKKDEKYEK